MLLMGGFVSIADQVHLRGCNSAESVSCGAEHRLRSAGPSVCAQHALLHHARTSDVNVPPDASGVREISTYELIYALHVRGKNYQRAAQTMFEFAQVWRASPIVAQHTT